MASQMVIPASNDTLFIRGFSSRQHVEEIRDFFNHEGGRNTVEFFKESQAGDTLFIALKFESRSVAKDILNRFDGSEVLGDHIGISWYKDVRKARAYDNMNYYRDRGPPNQRWPQDRYDYRGGGGGYGRGRGQFRGGGGNQRSGWYPRGSAGYGDRTRRYTRSSSRSHSRSASPRSRSRSYTRSSDDRGSRSRSDDSREATRKRRRSQSDASNRRRSSRKAKGRASSSSQSPEPDQDSRSGSESLPPPTEPVSGKKVKGRASGAKKSSASGSAERRTPSTAHDNKTKDLDPSRAEGDVEGSDVNDLAGDDMAMSPPPQPVPPPSAATKSGGRTAMRSAVSSVTAKKAGASAAAAGAKPTDDDVTDVAGSDGGNPVTRKPAAAAAAGDPAKVKKLKGRVMEDPISDEDDIFAEKSVPRRLTKESEEFLLERNKKSTKDAAPPSDSDPASPSEMMADEPTAPVSGKRKPGAAGKKQPAAPKDFDPFEEDMDDGAVDTTTATKRRKHEGSGRGGRAAAAANKRGPPAGAVGLSFEKMQLVRQKKEEIEKAYRQDCETFATVTKMLISKEPSLEDKIQNSLRENLKEIGHRCIQEMRDFIDRLKEEDIDDV